MFGESHRKLLLFDAVFCAEPPPDGFFKAMRVSGIDAKDTVALEDFPVGLKAAHASGLKYISVV